MTGNKTTLISMKDSTVIARKSHELFKGLRRSASKTIEIDFELFTWPRKKFAQIDAIDCERETEKIAVPLRELNNWKLKYERDGVRTSLH